MQTRLPSQQVTISIMYLSRLQSRDCCCSMGAMGFALALRNRQLHTHTHTSPHQLNPHSTDTTASTSIIHFLTGDTKGTQEQKSNLFFSIRICYTAVLSNSGGSGDKEIITAVFPVGAKMLLKCCLRFPTSSFFK